MFPTIPIRYMLIYKLKEIETQQQAETLAAIFIVRFSYADEDL